MSRTRTILIIAVALLACIALAALVFQSTLVAVVRSLPDRAGVSTTPVTLIAGTEAPRAADAFVDAIGVNVHLNTAESNYNQQYARFRGLLVAAGIRHLRDGLIDAPAPWYTQRLGELARAGVHADLITSVGQLNDMLKTYPARLAPGTIDAIEGPNEYDTSGSDDWALRLAGFQHRLYRTIRATPAYAGVPVIGPSLTHASAYRDVGDLSAALDDGNLHPYPAGREPATPGWGILGSWTARGSLAGNLADARAASGTKPLIITETGYGDAPAAAEGVPPAVKARYTVRVLFEAWNAGVTRTYLYQFLDAGIDGFQTYGLIDQAMRPKPAYVALASVIAHLRDPGPAAALTPLAYTLTGPPRLHHTLLERRDGSYALALWLAVPSWVTGVDEPIATTPQNVTLDFGAHARNVSAAAVQDTGAIVERALGRQTSVTLTIGDNVTLVDLR
jgi:hypothetical protein